MKRGLLPSIGALLAFESAARHGSFSRAAIDLNMTQSAISRQIRLLEENLGSPLFERVRKRVVLTDVGHHYVKDISKLLADLTEATYRVMDGGGNHTLKIATVATFATRWLIPRLPRFEAAHPNISLNLNVRNDPFDVIGEPFDLVIHFGNGNWPHTAEERLFPADYFPVCSPTYRKTHAIEQPTDLLRVRRLHLSQKRTAWTNWFVNVGLDPSAAFRGPEFEFASMISEAASAGLGVGLLPHVLIEKEIDEGTLEFLFDTPLDQGSYFLVFPEGKASSPPLQSFRDWIVQEARSYLDSLKVMP